MSNSISVSFKEAIPNLANLLEYSVQEQGGLQLVIEDKSLCVWKEVMSVPNFLTTDTLHGCFGRGELLLVGEMKLLLRVSWNVDLC